MRDSLNGGAPSPVALLERTVERWGATRSLPDCGLIGFVAPDGRLLPRLPEGEFEDHETIAEAVLFPEDYDATPEVLRDNAGEVFAYRTQAARVAFNLRAEDSLGGFANLFADPTDAQLDALVRAMGDLVRQARKRGTRATFRVELTDPATGGPLWNATATTARELRGALELIGTAVAAL